MRHSADSNLFRSDSATNARDILLMGVQASEGFHSHASAERNPLDLSTLKSYMSSAARHEESPSFTQRIMGTDTSGRTLLQKLKPNTSYAPPAVNTSALTQKTDLGTKNGQHVRNVCQTAQNQVANSKAQLVQDVKQMQKEARNAIGETAKDMGENVSDVQNTFSTAPPSTAIEAGGMMIADTCIFAGMGSFVTVAFQSAPAFMELSEKEKKLSPEKQEAVLKNALDRLKSSGTNASTADANEGATVKMDVPKASDVAWHNATPDDLRTILEMNPEALENYLPEMRALNDMESELKTVNDLHKEADNRPDIDATASNATGEPDSNMGKIKVSGDMIISAKDSLADALAKTNDADTAHKNEPPKLYQEPGMGQMGVMA